jgi:hypothetical protein
MKLEVWILLNVIQRCWKVKLIYKHYLGIYINESYIQCGSYYKLFPGILPGNKGIFKKQSFTHDSLRKFLDQLAPSRNRRIFIALPRPIFYNRCIEFPELPLDDVRDSVVSNLETYSHLSLEEIYYDIFFTVMKGKGINALLYYAPRKKIDVYINQFKDSGHINSLDGISPFSYGAGPWFWYAKDIRNLDEKNSIVIQYLNAIELAVYLGPCCMDSFLLDVSGENQAQEQVIHDILADHGMHPDQPVKMNDREDPNTGYAVLAPVTAGMQVVRVDENLPRIKLFRPIKILLPIFILLAMAITFMSFEIHNEIINMQDALTRIKQQISDINNEIDPILEAKTALIKAAEYKEDVEDFVSTRPPLYTYINDLALTVPPDTWFAHLGYNPGIISLQGEGDDVLKVVESLRNSKKYKEVKLQGSVSTTKEGKDNFRIDLILREPVDMIEGKEK